MGIVLRNASEDPIVLIDTILTPSLKTLSEGNIVLLSSNKYFRCPRLPWAYYNFDFPHASLDLHQLPSIPEYFTGRQALLATLCKGLPVGDNNAVAVLCGMPGAGKTALAYALAHEWAKYYPTAQIILSGGRIPGQSDPPSAELLMTKVIRAFYPSIPLPEDKGALCGQYLGILEKKGILIVLDDAEHRDQFLPLIPRRAGYHFAIIITSRVAFSVDSCTSTTVDTLSLQDSINLLRCICSGISVDNASTLANLCHGLPLALRLVGAILQMDKGFANIERLITRLQHGCLPPLNSAAEHTDVTHNISNTILLSEETLPENLRPKWRALSEFCGPFDADAAKAILDLEEHDLDMFVWRSLLERSGTTYFRLHKLMSEYAKDAIRRSSIDLSNFRYDARLAFHKLYARSEYKIRIW